MGIGTGRLRFQAVSQHVSFCFGFCRYRKQPWRGKANEQSEKVRRLSARLASKSRESCGSSVKHFFLVLQALCGLPLELHEHLRQAG